MWQGQRTRWTRLLRAVFPGGEASGDPEWGNTRVWQRKVELWNETEARSGRPHLGLGVLVTVIDGRQGRAEGREKRPRQGLTDLVGQAGKRQKERPQRATRLNFFLIN